MLKKLLLILAVLLVPVIGKAQDLTHAPIVFSSGKWIVKQAHEDTLPNSPIVCVGIYTDSSVNVQLSQDTLFADARPYGGVDSIAIRLFGTQIVYGRPASIIEHRVGIIIFPDEQFRMLLFSEGMRLAFFTPLGKVIMIDIVFDGLQDAHDFMRLAPGRCHSPVQVPPGASIGD